MRISFIGAGKTGTTLGLFFKQYGYCVAGYYSRTFKSALKASKITGTKAYDDLNKMVEHSDMIWITTNDDQIENVAKELGKLEAVHEGQIIVHASGAHSSEILHPLKEKGCDCFSIHPLQAFSDIETALQSLKATTFTIEGNGEKVRIIQQIFEKTENPYFRIDQSGKALYHAGACVLSNYLVTLIDVAYNLFEKSGIDRKLIFEATLPLIMGTLENIRLKDTKDALTGPIQRGDTLTIEKHMEAIRRDAPGEEDFYECMRLKTTQMLELRRRGNEK